MNANKRVKYSIITLSVAAILNFALALIKLEVGLSANSVCIMLDATNSFFDIVTCIITIIAFAILLKKEKKYDFGYGRGEYLSGFIVSVVSLVMGAVFMLRSVNRLAMPEPEFFGLESTILICVTFVIKLGMALGYFFINKKIQSKAIKALVADSFLDLGITGASLISCIISSNINYAVDAWFGIGISIVIIVFSIILIIDNIKTILFGASLQKEKNQIQDSILSLNPNREIKKIVLHDYGTNCYVGNVYLYIDKEEQLEDIDLEFEKIKYDVFEKYMIQIDCVPVLKKGSIEIEK